MIELLTIYLWGMAWTAFLLSVRGKKDMSFRMLVLLWLLYVLVWPVTWTLMAIKGKLYLR